MVPGEAAGHPAIWVPGELSSVAPGYPATLYTLKVPAVLGTLDSLQRPLLSKSGVLDE